MEKRDEARARKAVKSIEDLQKADDFRGAIKAFRANEALFKDERAKTELKTSLRKA